MSFDLYFAGSQCKEADKIPGEFGKIKTRTQISEAPKLSWENYIYER